MSKVKTLVEVKEQTMEDDRTTPAAIIGRVKYAGEHERKKSTMGEGFYYNQKFSLESGDGEVVLSGFSKSEFDLKEARGTVVIISIPPFKTKNPMIIAEQNGEYTNLKLGAKVEIWDKESKEPLSEVSDDSEWRFGGEAPAKAARPRKRKDTEDQEDYETGREDWSNKVPVKTPEDRRPIQEFTPKPVEKMSKYAEKYSEALYFAKQIAKAEDITDEQAICAMAATIFIQYGKQNKATLDLEDTAEVDSKTEPQDVELAKKRGRKPASTTKKTSTRSKKSTKNSEAEEDDED